MVGLALGKQLGHIKSHIWCQMAWQKADQCILDVDMAVSDTLSAEEGLDEVLGSLSVNGS